MERIPINQRLLTLVGIASGWYAASVAAQPYEAPPATVPEASAWVEPLPPGGPVRLAQSTEAISRPAVVQSPTPVAGPAQRGLLQEMTLQADWVPQVDDDSLGRSTLSASVGFGVPPFVFGMPLLVTPRAALHLVDGPEEIDVPARLNDFEVSFGTFKKLNERWSVRGSVTVGVYGDDYSLGDSDALRVSGLALAIWDVSPAWKWAFGAVYLNRDDITVVPAVGVIYDPGDIRYELILPRPRILWRLPQGVAGNERAFYLAGEFGGGAWAVERDNGTTETLNLSRWGLLLGYESSSSAAAGTWGGAKRYYEFGYLFGRDLEYDSSGEEFSLDDSIIARVGWTY